MRVTLLQTDIVWEDKQENLRRLRKKLETLRGATEVVVLPETFSTGFTMDTQRLAEPASGETITLLRQWAAEFRLAIAGSYIACDKDTVRGKDKTYYNRAFFLTPEGETYYYDKRHLFRMGNETEYFTAGNRRPVISYRGWNILLLVCYDLRFPVWSRNVNNEYDLLIYVANWAVPRRRVWDVLLQARALENISYVCGVNRIGTDGDQNSYNGGSVIYSPKGQLLADVPDNEEGIATATLDLSALREFRNKFPAWKDADSFSVDR
ncbi:amidohydrolase [Bacteroides sp. UBA939]|uniref:amidohydrolase n=1 Tax=Bacteroides sp. UBA939 TaxID=1946092 RepID=UPI0025C0BF58|nr:amidohydrolase [Bacteroides sp. UBA939]